MWLGLHLACYLVERIAFRVWHRMYNGAARQREFRFILMGRMLKFKPLPVPGEGENVVMEAPPQALHNIWFRVFDAIQQHTTLLTLGIFADIKYLSQVATMSEAMTIFLFVVHPFLFVLLYAVLCFNYWIRSHHSADIGRKKFDWMTKTSGYVTAQLEFATCREYDLDEEMQCSWRVLEKYKRRFQG